MSLFVVYHVVGVKVGCTKDFDRRCEENRITYGPDIAIDVLEEFTGTEEFAAEREAFHANAMGYRLGNPYDKAIHARREMARRSLDSPTHASKREECRQAFLKAGTAASNVKITCQHCGKTGQARAMLRWHFSNCRKAPNVVSRRISVLPA